LAIAAASRRSYRATQKPKHVEADSRRAVNPLADADYGAYAGRRGR
jgi:hypothetical protein